MEELLNGKKVKLTLVGKDGNIFFLMGEFSKAARRQGFTKKEVDSVTSKVMSASSYDEALGVLMEYTEAETE